MENVKFEEFPKLARLSRECLITEKIDGTNSSVFIQSEALEEFPSDTSIITTIDGYTIRAGSRTKWVTPGKSTDNYGFAGWVKANAQELVKLGEGRHYGEWWGLGIQRGYNMKEKVFSLFNVERWANDELRPKCCRVVPELWRGIFDTLQIDAVLNSLKENGSYASPGFLNPEGIVVYHTQGNVGFKKTLDKNDAHKSE